MRCSVKRSLLHSGPLGKRYSYSAYLGDYPGHRGSESPRLLLHAEQTKL